MCVEALIGAEHQKRRGRTIQVIVLHLTISATVLVSFSPSTSVSETSTSPAVHLVGLSPDHYCDDGRMQDMVVL